MFSTRQRRQQNSSRPSSLDSSLGDFNFGSKIQAGEAEYEKIEAHNDDLVSNCGLEMPEANCHSHLQVTDWNIVDRVKKRRR